LATLFRENGIEHERVNYFNQPFTAEVLRRLIEKTGARPFDLLRKGHDLESDTPDADVISAMVADPNLIQRPIVEVGDKAVLARPIDKALGLIKGDQ
jgi:arsenate reductase (glutaredoxin)